MEALFVINIKEERRNGFPSLSAPLHVHTPTVKFDFSSRKDSLNII